MTEFTAFPKIPRLKRDCVVTEKIDGTNAQVSIRQVSSDGTMLDTYVETDAGPMFVRAGSRNRWISPDNDNFGFASWVRQHANELAKLGVGQHFGEWWGVGIQRGYGLHERRFSLFNVARWADDAARPSCCHVVPTLFRGAFDSLFIEGMVLGMKHSGSVASPGFLKPEGVIVWHEAARQMFKITCEGDAAPKGQMAA